MGLASTSSDRRTSGFYKNAGRTVDVSGNSTSGTILDFLSTTDRFEKLRRQRMAYHYPRIPRRFLGNARCPWVAQLEQRRLRPRRTITPSARRKINTFIVGLSRSRMFAARIADARLPDYECWP